MPLGRRRAANKHPITPGVVLDMRATRRDILRFGVAGAASWTFGCALDGVAADGNASPATAGVVPIRIAGYDFDRISALAHGQVGVEGCDVDFEIAKIGDMNTDAFSGAQSRDVTEIGLSPFLLAWANGGFRDYVLIPVFPLRTFRHKSIFVNTASGIERPEDLRGRRVATPGFSSTSLTWIRGILADEYGVDQSDIDWVVSARDSSTEASGQVSQWESLVPEGLSVTTGPEGKDESDLLVDRDVDALFHAAEPRAFQEGDPRVRRLFPDSRAAEQAYFAKTGIFPIMHAVAVKRSTIERQPWLPAAVFRAYAKAKRMNDRRMLRLGWAESSLPWFSQELDDTQRVMGENFWPYGLGPNRKALDNLLRYSHAQGLAARRVEVDELFHGSTRALDDETEATADTMGSERAATA